VKNKFAEKNNLEKRSTRRNREQQVRGQTHLAHQVAPPTNRSCTRIFFFSFFAYPVPIATLVPATPTTSKAAVPNHKNLLRSTFDFGVKMEGKQICPTPH
jgi:hypothetical protein